MTPEGCYMRIGSSVENMPNNHIIDLFSKRTRNSLRNIISPRQDLSFSQLKIFYQEKNIFDMSLKIKSVYRHLLCLPSAWFMNIYMSIKLLFK